MRNEMNYEELLGAIARGWCTPVNERKVMDSDLAIAIAEEVVKYLAAPEQSEPIGEIVAEDMDRPFNAIQIRTHFYKEVPAVGTKLYTADQLAAAVLRERERCAKVCDDMHDEYQGEDVLASWCAAAIRAGGAA